MEVYGRKKHRRGLYDCRGGGAGTWRWRRETSRQGAGRGPARRRSGPAFGASALLRRAYAALHASGCDTGGVDARRWRLPSPGTWPAPRANCTSQLAMECNVSGGVAGAGRDRRGRLDRRGRHGRRAGGSLSDYAPAGWPEGTRMLMKSIHMDVSASPADPRRHDGGARYPPKNATATGAGRAQRRRLRLQLHPHQPDLSTGAKAAAVEHWYRRARARSRPLRDSKRGRVAGAGPPVTPSWTCAWMWAALLFNSIAGWLHRLTASSDQRLLSGWGTRGGKAMIASACGPAIIRVRPAGPPRRPPVLRPPPGYTLLAEVLARLRALPTGGLIIAPPSSANVSEPATEALFGPATVSKVTATTTTRSTNGVGDRLSGLLVK